MGNLTSDDSSTNLTRREFLKKTAGVVGTAATSSMFMSPDHLFAQPERPIKVGILVPLSGFASLTGKSIRDGMELYFDSVNYKAGGNRIEVVQEDTKFDPGEGLKKSRRLVERENVDLVAGVNSSAVLLALASYYTANKTLLLCANAGANQVSRRKKTPYIWRASMTNWMPNWPMGRWAYENVGGRAAVTALDFSAGQQSLSAFAHSFTKAGGEIVDVHLASFPKMGDPAPLMTSIRENDPDFVYAFYPAKWAVKFVKAYDDFGLKNSIPLIGTGFLTAEDVLPAQKTSSLGVRTGLYWAYLLDNPVNDEFKRRYRKKTGRNANVYAVHGYDTARTIVEAAERLNGDLSNVNKMLDVLPDISFQSPRGTFSLDKDTQTVQQHIYARRVVQSDETFHNEVIKDLGMITDPGDDSRDLKDFG